MIKIDLIKRIIVAVSDEVTVEVDLRRFFGSLSDEERSLVADCITWDAIMDKAVERLTKGMSAEGSWHDDDREHRLQILSSMEDQLLSGYAWSLLASLRILSRKLIEHKDLYWKLRHDQTYGDLGNRLFTTWLERQGISINYSEDVPDHQAFMQMVESKLDEMANKKRSGDSE